MYLLILLLMYVAVEGERADLLEPSTSDFDPPLDSTIGDTEQLIV